MCGGIHTGAAPGSRGGCYHGHSTGGGEAVHHLARHGESRVAKALRKYGPAQLTLRAPGYAGFFAYPTSPGPAFVGTIIDTGVAVVTNKRIVLVGAHRREWLYTKLVGLTIWTTTAPRLCASPTG
jgi:hypothetical protein